MKTIKIIFIVIPFALLTIPLLLFYYIMLTFVLNGILIWNWLFEDNNLNYDVNYYLEPFENWIDFIKQIIKE